MYKVLTLLSIHCPQGEGVGLRHISNIHSGVDPGTYQGMLSQWGNPTMTSYFDFISM